MNYIILTVAWWPLANTFVKVSGSISATAEVLVEIHDLQSLFFSMHVLLAHLQFEKVHIKFIYQGLLVKVTQTKTAFLPGLFEL